MFDANFYKKKAEQMGFGDLKEVKDFANKKYPPHQHEKDTLHLVEEGQITLVVFGKAHILDPGDHLIIPAGVIHEAHVGANGCVFISAERNEVK